MRYLELSNSTKLALIDDEDYNKCIQYTWSIKEKGSVRTMLRKTEIISFNLSNFIMQDFEHIFDHKDRDILNNQKNNLRIATRSQNMMNRKKIHGESSKYKGVSYKKANGKYIARITVDKETISLGLFFSERSAAEAYNRAAIKYHKEFAVLNEF